MPDSREAARGGRHMAATITSRRDTAPPTQARRRRQWYRNRLNESCPASLLTRPRPHAISRGDAGPFVQMRMHRGPGQHGARDAEIVMLPSGTAIDDPTLAHLGLEIH